MFPITRILLPVDFSERAGHAARFAVPLAERFCSEIILLHVLPPQFEFGAIELGGAMLGDLALELQEQAAEHLDRFASTKLGGVPVRTLLLEGDPAREIVETARREAVGLIMMPTHGYGRFRRLLLGSVTAKVLHDADCPVWTAAHVETPGAPRGDLKRILCAIDLGPSSARALQWSAELAAQFGAELTLVHAILELDPRTEGYHFSPEWRKFLAEAAQTEIAALQEKVGTQAEVILTSGPVAETVSEEARKSDADLLVIGRGVEAGILGRLTSDAYGIIRQSPCPVVSV